MPELSGCQLTCHSLHAAPGLAGWGEAGAGEPAQPPSCGRGSEQVGNCLSQDPCSRSTRWNVAVESVRQTWMYFLPPPHDFHRGLCSGVGGEVVLNWESPVWGSTRLWGWGRPAHPCSQPESQRLGVLGRTQHKRPAEQTFLLSDQILGPGRDE